MGRKILAVVVAMIIAVAIIWIGWMISTMIAPNPINNFEYATTSELADYIRRLPNASYLAAIVGYVLASFAGGFIVTKMSRRESTGMTLPIIIGVLLELGMVANILMLPGQPIWFIVAGFLTFIPLSLLGHRFAR